MQARSLETRVTSLALMDWLRLCLILGSDGDDFGRSGLEDCGLAKKFAEFFTLRLDNFNDLLL